MKLHFIPKFLLLSTTLCAMTAFAQNPLFSDTKAHQQNVLPSNSIIPSNKAGLSTDAYVYGGLIYTRSFFGTTTYTLTGKPQAYRLSDTHPNHNFGGELGFGFYLGDHYYTELSYIKTLESKKQWAKKVDNSTGVTKIRNSMFSLDFGRRFGITKDMAADVELGVSVIDSHVATIIDSAPDYNTYTDTTTVSPELGAGLSYAISHNINLRLDGTYIRYPLDKNTINALSAFIGLNYTL